MGEFVAPSDPRVKARFTVTAQGCYSRNVGHEGQAAVGLILHAVRLSVKLELTTQAPPSLLYVLQFYYMKCTRKRFRCAGKVILSGCIHVVVMYT